MNHTKRRSSYKLTFMDRLGPEGGDRLKAIGHGLTVFGAALVMFILVAAKIELFQRVSRGCVNAGLSAGACTLAGFLAVAGFAVALAAAFGAIAAYVGLRGGAVAGDVARFFTAGGSSTPYEEQFSEEQARVMQSDFAGAAALFEHRIMMGKGNPDPRVLLAAADLYATHAANPTRAAELYREVQRLPTTKPGQDVYASNRLADLFLGPLEQPGRALVEFRRLIHRYPNSRTADQARMALANLKPDLVKEEDREA